MSFFVFKQKTAYEKRISDWSSGVCSSDLLKNAGLLIGKVKGAAFAVRVEELVAENPALEIAVAPLLATRGSVREAIAVFNRSEERRVGKECVSTCRSRWTPNP